MTSPSNTRFPRPENSPDLCAAPDLSPIDRRRAAVKRWLLAFEAGCSVNFPKAPARTAMVARERCAAERLVERGAISPHMHRLHEIHRESEDCDDAWRPLEEDDRLYNTKGAIGPIQLYEILSNYTESEKLAYRRETVRRQKSMKGMVTRLRARLARKIGEDRQGILAFGE